MAYSPPLRLLVPALLLALVPVLDSAAAPPSSLAAVEAAVVKAAARRQRPTVVFDLDDTLFDAGSRTLGILREYAREPAVRAACPGLGIRLARLKAADIAYDLARNLASHGLEACPSAETALAFWKARFFTDAYCSKDAPGPGASAYVNRLHRLGARIVYLTGRDVPNMLAGTAASLAAHGFPLDDRTSLILKPRFEDDDTIFKESVFARLKGEGRVVACFENEPRNLNAMHKAFPGALMVFLDTRHSTKPDVPDAGIPWIKDYR